MAMNCAVCVRVRGRVSMDVLLDDVILRVAGEHERKLFDLFDDPI